MNDTGYIKCDFKNSISYNTVKTANKGQLLNRLPYVEGVIKFHQDENNPNQIKFFQDQLNLIKRRLKRLEGIGITA